MGQSNQLWSGRQNVSIIRLLILVVCVSLKIACNGLGICDGAVIEFRQLSFVLKLDRITEVEHLTSSRTIANTLLQAVLF